MDADTKKLFNYICGIGGSVTFKRLREHPSPLAKLNPIETRRKLEGIAENHKCFVLERKDGQLLNVKMFFKIRLCINYANKKCKAGKSCKYWHICKDYLEETCNKPNCSLSHSFKDEQNIGKLQDLGLDNLSGNSIRNILSNCLPRICVDYNTSNSCSLGNNCSNMHLCSKFVQNACLESNCRLQHNFKSWRNASILRRANLPMTMPDKIIFHHILMPQKLKLKQEEINSIKQATGINREAKSSNSEEVKQIKKTHRDLSRSTLDISSSKMLVENDGSSQAPLFLKHEGKQSRQNEPVEKDVFNTLVTEYQSVTKFSTITSREDLFPSNFIDKESWFRKRCNTFILSENKKGDIEEIRAFSKRARLCFNSMYCKKDDCKFFHLCRSLISGHCALGGTCNTNHDVTDPRDLRNLSRYNLEHLTSDQFLHLLRASTPHICFDYNKTGRCPKGERCIKLHICQKFVKKSCSHERKCRRDHDAALSSEHTQKVLVQYDVHPNVILKTLLIARETQLSSREEHQSKAEYIHMDSKERSICTDFILGKCRSGKGSSCDMHHCRYPYVWQHQDSCLLSWTSFDAKDSETLEKSFCDPSVEKVTHNLYLNLPCRPGHSKVDVDFKQMSYHVHNSSLEIKLRRLSTNSQLLNPDVTLGTKWVWFWDNGSSFVEYGNTNDEKMQNEIESFFLSNAECYPFKTKEYSYNLYFSGMYQINLNPVYSTKRMVRRRPVFRELGKVSQLIEQSRTDTRKEKQSNLPSEWAQMAPEKEFVRFKLPPNNTEYLKIEKLFRKTVSENKAVIVAIERVQNPFMWGKYMRKKEQMQQRAGVSPVDERMLFHGTSSDIVDNICKENFDWRMHGKTNGAVYGQGSYFARDAKYSYRYSGKIDTSRFMFVAKVLVGSFTEGKQEMRKPPSKSTTDSSSLFDSCVNDVNNPTIFVVFDIDQYYPSHVIEFTAKETSKTSAASSLSGYGFQNHNTLSSSRVSGSTQVKAGQNTNQVKMGQTKHSYGSQSGSSSTTSTASNQSISSSRSSGTTQVKVGPSILKNGSRSNSSSTTSTASNQSISSSRSSGTTQVKAGQTTLGYGSRSNASSTTLTASNQSISSSRSSGTTQVKAEQTTLSNGSRSNASSITSIVSNRSVSSSHSPWNSSSSEARNVTLGGISSTTSVRHRVTSDPYSASYYTPADNYNRGTSYRGTSSTIKSSKSKKKCSVM